MSFAAELLVGGDVVVFLQLAVVTGRWRALMERPWREEEVDEQPPCASPSAGEVEVGQEEDEVVWLGASYSLPGMPLSSCATPSGIWSRGGGGR